MNKNKLNNFINNKKYNDKIFKNFNIDKINNCNNKKKKCVCKKKKSHLLKYLIIFVSILFVFFVIIFLFIKRCKKNTLNNEIINSCNDVLIPYLHNLKDINSQIKNNENPYLTTSNIEYMNCISKNTSEILNEVLIDKGYAKIINNYLGIFQYYCDKNCKLKKKIFTKFLLNNFLTSNGDILEKNTYTNNDITVPTLKNLLCITDSLSNCIKELNLKKIVSY
jgi:hypothetical protein